MRMSWWLGLVGGMFALLAAGCGAAARSTPTQPAAEAPTAPGEAECHQGLLRAIEREIARYEGWLAEAQGEEAERYRAALAYLRDLQRQEASASAAEAQDLAYRPIPVEGVSWQTSLPSERTVVLDDAWLEGPLPAQVLFAGQTRSGPFYIATAAVPEVVPGQHYRLTLRLLMPGSYPFPEYYVCIVAAEPRP